MGTRLKIMRAIPQGLSDRTAGPEDAAPLRFMPMRRTHKTWQQ